MQFVIDADHQNCRLGFEAQVIGAAINNSGLLTGRLHVDWFDACGKVICVSEINESRIRRNECAEVQTCRTPVGTSADEIGLGVRASRR